MSQIPLKSLTAAVFVGAAFLGQSAPVLAQDEDVALKPLEDVWFPAPTPEGGVSWETLEATGVIEREVWGMPRQKPDFTDEVAQLAGTRIKVNGYPLPLQNSAKQTHFVLMAYPPDCPFHLNPAPTQFIEVHSSRPIAMTSDVQTIEGVLELTGEDESGVFYRLVESTEIRGG